MFNWRKSPGGGTEKLEARIRKLEEENRRLKKMYAESKMDAEILREALSGKY